MKKGILNHSIIHLLLEHEREHAEKIYLRQPREGCWHEFTWAQVMHQARQVASFLHSLGLKKGAHVSILSKNCAEWFIADFGVSLAGMVNIPLFANQHASSIQYVLNHGEVELVFLGKLDNHAHMRSSIPEHVRTISFDYHPDMQTTYQWAAVLASEPLQEVILPKACDLFTIIYSSGTSGTPKGAMYTHEAIANYLNIFSTDIRRMIDLPYYHLLSYLPLAHVYERSAIQLGSLAIPSDVSFVESLDAFAENLRTVKPNIFAAVPRIWDVFQHKIEQKISPQLLNILLKLPIISGLIKKKIKQQLGLENSQANISGAAHLPVSILRFFDKINIPIQEGYGQTENFAYATLSLLNERKPGFVGTPRLQVEIKYGENNELIMKSPCLMRGYYKDEEATAEAFTADGWLRTGDIVEIDAQNRVKILGRVSENFKNLKGEFIAPTPIEKEFFEPELIENVCLVGRELARNVLLVSLTNEGRRKPHEEIKEYLQVRLHATNQTLKSYEKISHILIVKEPWTPENNLLTPTLKVRRRQVEAHYHAFIQQAVTDHHLIVWE
ncbi:MULTISPECIES: AMP-binding protein [Legionella]|uniref:AMP-binding protein n=1 Tax=Legionella septentrionalis TaxID=2498109 RepID=A0A433JGD7_9GAMM|nr:MULTISPECIES: AMP-binding protein [Legionella]MCP0912965.1 AMP-binding protein [Legionella sp. 27cVA30]RUQ78857.1 AMP-binding protein [Legionella septentrionalis]RUQ96743.1 AMP-binding protein [Legionella septentrionalis]RUR10152.1 AMP-binding protein [Legionella septentrionalis]